LISTTAPKPQAQKRRARFADGSEDDEDEDGSGELMPVGVGKFRQPDLVAEALAEDNVVMVCPIFLT
jgi:hypothetical protein